MNHMDIKYFLTRLWYRKEALLWLAALIWLAIDSPVHHHYTLCPFQNMGISFCPGCGLGRSIGLLFRLNIEASFQAHPLGIPAVILIVTRFVKVLLKDVNIRLSTI